MMPEELKRTSFFGQLSAHKGSERPMERPNMTRRATHTVAGDQRRSSFVQIQQATKKASHSFGERVARSEAYLARRNQGAAAMPIAYHLVRILDERKKKEAETPVKISRSSESFKQGEVLSHLLIAETLAKEQAMEQGKEQVKEQAKEQATEQAKEHAQAEMKKKEKKQAKKDKDRKK
jgi:hypothetical protein